MKPQVSTQYDSFDDPLVNAEGLEETPEDDLRFLPGPMEVGPDYLPPGPRAELRETAVLDDWRKAEARNAARLARVAGRIGALDDRLHRGPEGWRHRLALIEAADLSWFVGDRIGPDRLALWIYMRLPQVSAAGSIQGSGDAPCPRRHAVPHDRQLGCPKAPRSPSPVGPTSTIIA
jgi:hypothetical protein